MSSQRRWVPVLALWLTVCVLLAQTTVLMHRVAHRVGSPAQTCSVRALTPIDTPTSAQWIEALWGDHDNTRDCDQFDQLGALALTSAAWVLAVWVSHFFGYSASKPDALGGRRSFYQAQAPPRSV